MVAFRYDRRIRRGSLLAVGDAGAAIDAWSSLAFCGFQELFWSLVGDRRDRGRDLCGCGRLGLEGGAVAVVRTGEEGVEREVEAAQMERLQLELGRRCCSGGERDRGRLPIARDAAGMDAVCSWLRLLLVGFDEMMVSLRTPRRRQSSSTLLSSRARTDAVPGYIVDVNAHLARYACRCRCWRLLPFSRGAREARSTRRPLRRARRRGECSSRRGRGRRDL
ncbi:hypothetical protein PYCCODRAFT_367500 [Trametes coccinea BRFM310]|uniref:Uncharacterized protein n=1 Tax=Trametes coccinea (strain BRFM310) TaxID=1353009 RepID=A0A1Y2J3E6_TRAC3|nr:hypothetical protein PYCCODRAFT_367500 [Trametes coccinea BRFM310]